MTRGISRQKTLAFLYDLTHSADINVVWIGSVDHDEGVTLLRARPDKEYSLCDAVSFVLMRRYRLTEAFTTDHHFEQEGFVRLLQPY